MDKLLDEISFDAPDLSGQTIIIDAQSVQERLKDIIKDEDLSRYILEIIKKTSDFIQDKRIIRDGSFKSP
jgi:hypothetical protein